jgi:hypothetical protein
MNKVEIDGKVKKVHYVYKYKKHIYFIVLENRRRGRTNPVKVMILSKKELHIPENVKMFVWGFVEARPSTLIRADRWEVM